MIILVAGLPGSGKSFFAEKLAARIRAFYLNSDRVRTEMNVRGKYSYADRLAVYDEMARKASYKLKSGADVLIDATFFHHSLRELFVRLANAYSTSIYVIEVIADEELIKARLYNAREFSEADYQVYERIRDEFEEITMPHLILTSTNDNLEEMLTQAIEYVGI